MTNKPKTHIYSVVFMKLGLFTVNSLVKSHKSQQNKHVVVKQK